MGQKWPHLEIVCLFIFCSLLDGWPQRVSACNSHTDHVSKYIDYILKPQMQSLPSYIKDTTDFIIKLKQFQVTSEKAYLVTLDVSSLYTNIPHEDGIEAYRYFLENNGHSGSLSVDNVCALIELVLQNNYFKFSDISYRQKMGTAMGSSMAPAYASLFMGKFEMDFMKICSEKPTLWLRFLDDIFMVWTHSHFHLQTDYVWRWRFFKRFDWSQRLLYCKKLSRSRDRFSV